MHRIKRSIKTTTDRAALPLRREPYWHPISKGLAVGYRVSKIFDHGIWQARWRDPSTGKHLTTSLGHFTDIPNADGRRIETKAFDQALNAAQAWASDMKVGVVNTRPTVLDACQHYVNTALDGRPKAQAGARASFRYRVAADSISTIKLAELRKQHLRDWMQRCVTCTLTKTGADSMDVDALRRARDTVNRDFRTLRAALNRAYSDGMCGSKVAWSGDIAFENTTRGRTNYLTEAQTIDWINRTPQPLSFFLKGLLLTAARPGELAEARVQDFNRSAATLTITTGKRKEGHAAIRRTIPLTEQALALIDDCARGKIGNAPLFADALGRPWNRQSWQSCGDYAKLAGLPLETTAYDLRHATISRWLAGGLSIFEVSKLAGTSPQMIERHYGHLLTGITRTRLDDVARATEGH